MRYLENYSFGPVLRILACAQIHFYNFAKLVQPNVNTFNDL